MAHAADAGSVRRDRIVEFMREYVAKHGFWATTVEIAEGVGLASASTAHRHLERLIDEGRVERTRVTRDTEVFTLTERGAR